MKVFNVIVKVTVALAAVAGAVYVAATYGDQIVDWAKKTLERLQGGCKCCCGSAESSEDVPVSEHFDGESAPENDMDTVTADETDFEG